MMTCVHIYMQTYIIIKRYADFAVLSVCIYIYIYSGSKCMIFGSSVGFGTAEIFLF